MNRARSDRLTLHFNNNKTHHAGCWALKLQAQPAACKTALHRLALRPAAPCPAAGRTHVAAGAAQRALRVPTRMQVKEMELGRFEELCAFSAFAESQYLPKLSATSRGKYSDPNSRWCPMHTYTDVSGNLASEHVSLRSLSFFRRCCILAASSAKKKKLQTVRCFDCLEVVLWLSERGG